MLLYLYYLDLYIPYPPLPLLLYKYPPYTYYYCTKRAQLPCYIPAAYISTFLTYLTSTFYFSSSPTSSKTPKGYRNPSSYPEPYTL